MNETLTSITLFVGIIFSIIGLIFKTFPPKKMNWIYGYRTSSSMKNMDTWNVANKYSAELMLVEGIALTITGVVTLFIPDTGVTGAMAIGLVLLSAIILIVATERHLNKVFDTDGNRKHSV